MPNHVLSSGRSLLSVTTIGLMALPAMVPMTASADDAALAELVKRQSAMLEAQAKQLQAMQARLNRLEADEQQDRGASLVTSPPATTSPQQDVSIDKLKNRVALLEASQVDRTRIDWSDGGPKFISANGKRSLEINGRLQLDASNTSGSRFDSRNIGGTQARRLQFGVSGQLSERIGYKMEYDLSSNDISMRDAYVSSDFKFGEHDATLYVGNKYDDRTMDGATSSNNTWFMERGFVNEALGPERGSYGLGIKGKVFGDSRTWHTSLAITNGRLGGDTDRSDSTTYMTRSHWNPWTSGSDMVHLGAWGFHENIHESDTSATQNTRAADGFNDNVTINSRPIRDPESSNAYGFELATSLGPFAAAAEYGKRSIQQRDSAGGDDVRYDAYSVQAGYFLTGENHGYSRKSGVWRLPEVKDPVSAGGWGAFELATRYQALDFDGTSDYPRGDGHSTTVGLNWYPNDWSRVMFNYIHWNTHNRSGDYEGKDDGDTLATRLQVVF
ncbi:hypothetical protein F0A16_09415 [Salinicola corii]|uniref:Porin n=1 Tax=Salinicola corii TaxID=2606937 RepID=A0A640WF06_9GAMM|nr:porin [Salinicola corii]KAA0018712.1 hypothetical protein F0A16_09415 [Salinicola corii]